MEAEEESCLDEVLASLPDIDDSKIFLSRFGSLNGPVDHQDHVIESFFTLDASENGNRSSLVQAEPWDTRIPHHYSENADLQQGLKPPPRESAFSHAGNVQGSQSQWRHEPCSPSREELYQTWLLSRSNSTPTQRLQNFPTPIRQKGKMIVSCHVQEDEVQSTCSSLNDCHHNQHNKEHQHDHQQQEVNISDGLSPARVSSLTLHVPDLISSQLQPSCIPKLESGTQLFPKMNGFYIQSNS